MRSSEREEKGALKTANLGERDRTHSCPRPGPTRPHTLWPHMLRPPLRSYDQTRSCPVPRGPFLPAQTTRPHLPAQNGQLNGIPPVRAPYEGFRQGLGRNREKTKKLGK